MKFYANIVKHIFERKTPVNENIRKALKGFLELTDAEKQEFNKAVKEYMESPYAQRIGIEKNILGSKDINS